MLDIDSGDFSLKVHYIKHLQRTRQNLLLTRLADIVKVICDQTPRHSKVFQLLQMREICRRPVTYPRDVLERALRIIVLLVFQDRKAVECIRDAGKLLVHNPIHVIQIRVPIRVGSKSKSHFSLRRRLDVI